jgi:exonuclease III
MMSFLLLVVSGSIHPNPGPFVDLSICHIIARSLYTFDNDLKSNRTKLDEIESVLCLQYRYDIICISETWLKSNISCEDIKINKYTVYRKDRSDNSSYRGVAIYVVDHLLSQRRLEIEVQSLEYLCVEIKNNGKSILVGVCYRPPSRLLNV